MKNIIIPPIIQKKCPIWTNRIKTEPFTKLKLANKIVDNQLTSLNHKAYCLVGECYLFTDIYSDSTVGNELFCFECELLSERIYHSYSIKEFQSKLNEFAEHLEEKHDIGDLK